MTRNFLFLVVFLFGCSQEKTLPESTGLFSEIVFVVDDSIWKNEVSKLIYKVFSSHVEGASQKESEYNVLQLDPSEFKSFFMTHKNIVFINKNTTESSIKNKWSKKQIVFQLNWSKDTTEFLSKCRKVKTIFDVNEIRFLRKISSKESNKDLEKKIKSKFNIDIVLPEKYIVVEDSANFFWATYNPKKHEEIKHIIFYSFVPKNQDFKKETLSKTDSVFSKYLLGVRENSFVKIEPLYKPFFSNNIFRGLWKLENGFMGGPFLIKRYVKEDRVVVGAGVIFAPQSRKRKHIKEMEAIL